MLLGAALSAQTAQAAVVPTPVALQNATATLSQSGGFNISETIDGSASAVNGWAIYDGSGTDPQTAVWETAADLSASSLTVRLMQVYGNHLLGRFRLSTTTDDRSTFADGLQNGGDVTAAWTMLESPTVTSIAGMVFTTLVDNSVLVGGTLPATAVYELTYNVNLVGVTGLRLEAMSDPSLPDDGPGAGSLGGNFVLTRSWSPPPPFPSPPRCRCWRAGWVCWA
jgi:hypothetical protein